MKIVHWMIFQLGFIVTVTYPALNARITTNKAELTRFLENADAGPGAKLVFYDQGKLYYVDFTRDTLQIQELSNAAGGVLPVISPDGEYFVFARGVADDGETKDKSTAYICGLSPSATPVMVAETAYVPRFIQNSSLPVVLYSTCALNSDPAKHAFQGCGAVVKRALTDGNIGKIDTVWSKGSYFGGLSYDERFLATAWLGDGNSFMVDITDLNSKPVLSNLMVKKGQNGIDTIRTCNPSISSSRVYTDVMMAVDFGNLDAAPLVHPVPELAAFWDFHELLLITNAKGELIKNIGQKFRSELTLDEVVWESANGQSDGSSWDYPEWSNHPYLAVACVNVSRHWKKTLKDDYYFYDNSERIYLINLKDTSALQLISSTDTLKNSVTNLKWPWFWTSVPKDFSEQPGWLSAGIQSIQGKKLKNRDPLVKLSGNKIHSSVPIEHISVVDLSGRCLWKTHFGTYVSDINIPLSLNSGRVYIIQIKPCGNPFISFRSIKIE